VYTNTWPSPPNTGQGVIQPPGASKKTPHKIGCTIFSTKKRDLQRCGGLITTSYNKRMANKWPHTKKRKIVRLLEEPRVQLRTSNGRASAKTKMCPAKNQCTSSFGVGPNAPNTTFRLAPKRADKTKGMHRARKGQASDLCFLKTQATAPQIGTKKHGSQINKDVLASF